VTISPTSPAGSARRDRRRLDETPVRGHAARAEALAPMRISRVGVHRWSSPVIVIGDSP